MTGNRLPHLIRWSMVAVAALWTMDGFAHFQVPGPKQSHPIALVGGVIHTVDGPVHENATLLFEDGKITAIGRNITLPPNTERIDVPGKHIYPGLIAANTVLGLTEIDQVRATLDIREVGEITANVRAEVAFNPDSELIPVTRANGIALAQVIPVWGQSALMMLDGWTWEEMTQQAPLGLHIQWPWAVVNRNNVDTSRRNHAEGVQRIRDRFADARAYWKAKEAQGERDVSPLDSDLRWEAFGPVLKREVPVFIHADSLIQIESALDWAQEEEVRIVIVGGRDAWRTAERLRAMEVPVILEGTQTLNLHNWDPYDKPFTLPLKLHEAGVEFCIGWDAGMPGGTRNLPYHAATAAAYGLPKDEALKAVTLYPARIFGVEDRVGSLTVGKDATLIVTDGDPLEIRTHVEQMFIQGRAVDLSSRHTMLYEKYQEKYQQ